MFYAFKCEKQMRWECDVMKHLQWENLWSAYLFAHVHKNLLIFIFYLDFRVKT